MIICVCFSWCFLLTEKQFAYFAVFSCICGKSLSIFLILCSTFPFPLTIVTTTIISGEAECRKQTWWCNFCVKVTPDAWILRSQSTHSCLLYHHWWSWLFTAGQNNPQATAATWQAHSSQEMHSSTLLWGWGRNACCLCSDVKNTTCQNLQLQSNRGRDHSWKNK